MILLQQHRCSKAYLGVICFVMFCFESHYQLKFALGIECYFKVD